jgi:hypothetical protein
MMSILFSRPFFLDCENRWARQRNLDADQKLPCEIARGSAIPHRKLSRSNKMSVAFL